MGTVASEFRRFVESIAEVGASDDAQRVAKIVQGSLDQLIPTGTAGGRRATVLTPILRMQFDTTDATIVANVPQRPPSPIAWDRLNELTVGPFRGFRFEEKFDLNKRIVLFYGPNGSGKTSLCEAFELSMLGFIEEAEARRFSDIGDYAVNIHEDAVTRPTLTCSLSGANPVPLIADADQYRFCIIEKNRIDNFARIAARSTASGNALIGALFGLEDFDNFVNGFTSNLNSQLNLGRPLQDELENRRRSIESDSQVVASHAAALDALIASELALARSYDASIDFAGLRALVGADGHEGRLQELERILEQQLPALTNISIDTLKVERRRLRALLHERKQIQAHLQNRSREVSFDALYHALLELRPTSPDKCPACSTPFAGVVENPYSKAERGLTELGGLAKLEQTKERVEESLRSAWSSMRSELERVAAFRDLSPEQAGRARRALDRISEASSVPDPLGSYEKSTAIKLWCQILRSARRAARQDRATNERTKQRAALMAERQRLRDFLSKVEAASERRRMLEQNYANAQRRIAEFQAQNADLYSRAQAEEMCRLREQRISSAYGEFIALLDDYRRRLPHLLIADLNEITRDIYNSFNAGDHPDDLLASLTMPLEGGREIQIAFNGAPTEPRNALHVLSEGHIRCLGLAILLAQNFTLDLPVIIFDDPVNAIDHDHRGGIRDTLLDDDRFRRKQILITSHSNEFIKDVQNHVGNQNSVLYVLRHHDGDHVPKVTHGSCRHYLERAERHLEELDLRAVLAYARQALEHLTQLLWKKLHREDLGDVTLDHRGPGAPIDLNHFTGKLRAKVHDAIEDGRLTDPKWQTVLEALTYILGIDSTNLVWIYLNKGVHDEHDRDDFEEPIVRRVVNELQQMDEALRRPRNSH